MNEGRFIFSQVVDFVPLYEFDKFEYIEEFSQGSYNSNVITDYIVLMTNKKSRQLYPDELRLVKVFDYEKKE